MEQHLIILGLVLAGLTPAITAAVKKWILNNPALSSLMPAILTAIAWFGDSLIMGISPFGEAGLAMLVAALTGSLAGAKGRDVYKHTMKKAA